MILWKIDLCLVYLHLIRQRILYVLKSIYVMKKILKFGLWNLND